MHRLFVVALVVSMSWALSACSEKGRDKDVDKKSVSSPKKAHEPGDASSEIISFADVIKRKTLPDYPSMTIGTAFEKYKYFNKLEWQEARTGNGKIYIDCRGWFDAKYLDAAALAGDVAAQGLAVKFVITQAGDFGVVMIAKLEAKKDGQVYMSPQEDMKGILGKLYGNKEIRF